MRHTAVGAAVFLGLLLGSAFSQAPPVKAGEPASDRKTDRQRSDLFGPDKLWSIHLKLGAKEYATLPPAGGRFGFPKTKNDPPPNQDAPKRDVHKNNAFGLEFPWVKGDLLFDGTFFKDVGIRYKGNATYGMSQHSLSRPFKIDINHYVDTQQLYGLNGFALGNNAFDPSRLHDALGYHLFRAAKVPASRTAFVKLSLSVAHKYDQTYLGLYTLMEPVDKAFLREHFGSDKGMLLKPERIQGLQYLGESWDAYQDKYNPRREPSDAQKRRLIDFTRLVHQADDATFRQKIGEFLDVDAFLRFAAVNSLIANLDGFFAGGHNYFLYLNPQDNRFHFMPWDLDVTFGGHPFARGDQTDWSIAQPYVGRSRLTERILAVKENDARFRQHLRTLLEGPFSVKAMTATIDMMEATIKDALVQAPKVASIKLPGGEAMPVRTFVARRNASVLAQLDGKSPGTAITFGPGPGGKGGAPDEVRRQIADMIGPLFVIFRGQVQDDLKLTGEQRKKLEHRLQKIVGEAMPFFERLHHAMPEDRQREQRAYTQKSQEKLMAFLEGALHEEQLQRLHQIMLQREGLFALGNPALMKELQITDPQRQQFASVVQSLQKKVEAMLKEVQQNGRPEEARPRMLKIRAAHLNQIEAILNDTQKAHWRKMLGKPLDLGD